jgi:hypothetical protein
MLSDFSDGAFPSLSSLTHYALCMHIIIILTTIICIQLLSRVEREEEEEESKMKWA